MWPPPTACATHLSFKLHKECLVFIRFALAPDFPVKCILISTFFSQVVIYVFERFSWKTRQFVRCGQLVSSVCCLVWDNIFLSRSKCRRTRRAEYELQVVKVGDSAVVLPINIYRLSMRQQYLPAKSIPKYRLSFPFQKIGKFICIQCMI